MANENLAGTSTIGSEFLTFTLGSEEYGMDILKVQEIRGYDAVTTIANTPEFIKGVINLRGTIVPIVDLRIKFHLGTVEYNQLTVVIILNLGTPRGGHRGGQRVRCVGADAGTDQACPGFVSRAGYALPHGTGHGRRAHVDSGGY